MSCAGHLLQSQEQRNYSGKIRVTAIIKNVSVEELGAIMTYLREYRKEHASCPR